MVPNLPKIIVVLGPTASGKTALGAKLAQELGGEIISADSRQLYRGLNLGSGKERLKIPQHLIDIADPGERVTVADWKARAEKVIAELLAAKKIPIVVGGSGLYLSALIDNFVFAPEDASGKIRRRLDTWPTEKLAEQLCEQDAAFAATLPPNNRRYLIRALERAAITGSPRPRQSRRRYESLLLGVTHSRPVLYRRIDERVDSRLQEGMLDEVRQLLASGVSADWLLNLGLEYRYLTRHLLGELTYDEAVRQLKFAIHHFARRQEIWWRRRPDILWVKKDDEALSAARAFLA